MNVIENKEWSQTSKELITDPYNLKKWQKLIKEAENNEGHGINKISSPEEREVLRQSYRQMLKWYPLLTWYWIRFAEWEFKLDNYREALSIYEEAIQTIPCSIELWVKYLEFRIKTIGDDLQDILKLFETARRRIGYHFHSHEFYKLYLSFLKNYASVDESFTKKYYVLLRIVIEIPLYHYDYFFKTFFSHISESNISEEVVVNIVPEKELSSMNTKDMKSVSLKLKKIFTDVYITTQYKVYQLFYFEKKLTRHYFDVSYISQQELGTWENYISFMLLNYSFHYVITTFERCLIATANYPKFWIQLADYLINLKMYASARETLKRGLWVNKSFKLLVKLIDLEIYLQNFSAARDLTTSYIKLNKFIPIEIHERLLGLEHLVAPDDIEHMLQIFRELIKETKNDYFFSILLNYPFPDEQIEEFMEEFQEQFSSSFTFAKCQLYIYQKLQKDTSNLITHYESKLLPENFEEFKKYYYLNKEVDLKKLFEQEMKV